MNGISFIVTCRNDGYGGTPEELIKRTKIFCDSVFDLGIEHEIVFVEWDPVFNKKYIVEEFKTKATLKHIVVDAELQSLLDAERKEKSLPVYEYLAKEIGVTYAKYDNIILTNPDNIFIRDWFFETFMMLDSGKIVIATRTDIHRSVLNRESMNYNDLPRMTHIPIGQASGDFLGIKKQIFLDNGGYIKVHANWDVDREFKDRLRNTGHYIYNTLYVLPHIDHDQSGEREDFTIRPSQKLAKEMQPISQSIIDKMYSYVEIK
ncbi:MAG: hypothetical protein KKB59_19705 [Spirochaetes bacterium]|nr:hypothetical protein [Spirochaetota bacterium]